MHVVLLVLLHGDSKLPLRFRAERRNRINISPRCFVPQLPLGDLPSMNFAISLNDKAVSDENVLHHLNALGDNFSDRWCYDETRSANFHFFKIEALTTVPYEVASKLGYPTDKIEILLKGTLSPGQPESFTGFRSHLVTQIHFPELYDMDYPAEPRLIDSYPCAHVPVPAGWGVGF